MVFLVTKVHWDVEFIGFFEFFGLIAFIEFVELIGFFGFVFFEGSDIRSQRSYIKSQWLDVGLGKKMTRPVEY